MNTSRAVTKRSTPPQPQIQLRRGQASLTLTLITALGLLFAMISRAPGSTVLGPWNPMFKGVDHAIGTNTPGGGGFAELQVVHLLRVDLTDPDIQLYASPRTSPYAANSTEAAGYTTTNFLKNHNLQAAINANSFYLPGSSTPVSYTLAEGTALNVSGLLISQGIVVSPQSSAEDSSAMLFTANNEGIFVPTNWPAHNTSDINTAVSGLYPILVNGINVGSNYLGNPGSLHGLEPRTAMGLSQNRQYLYLLVIDGRQNGFSSGAYDWETAAWLLLAGAWDGCNLDGGGSTCMVVMDSTGHPLPLNRDSASAAYNRERTVGAHFGVYAKPLPGFFENVMALSDNLTATISWTSICPATTQLKYGLTPDLNLTTALDSSLVTNHAVLLTHLSPSTEYYFSILGSDGTNQHVSPVYSFVTTNYLTTNRLFDLTNSWKYTTANLDQVNWASTQYDDSSWEGPSPGALWADIRGANEDITLPLNTQMPENPDTGYPFMTYYFRTHFNYSNQLAGASLVLEHSIDDGAVFYLNGTEIHRLRMAQAPTVIYNATRALDYPCSGNATCFETLPLSGPVISTNLVVGDNLLAVEVHNYNAASPDITFALSAVCTVPYVLNPNLNLSYSNQTVTLSWSRGGFTLQQADSPTGTWTDVPGPVISSPFTTYNSGPVRFFRLRQ
jgi:hypothetical protein